MGLFVETLLQHGDISHNIGGSYCASGARDAQRMAGSRLRLAYLSCLDGF